VTLKSLSLGDQSWTLPPALNRHGSGTAVREFDEMGFDLDVWHQNQFAQAPVSSGILGPPILAKIIAHVLPNC
jgi:hypothetical protein